MGLAGGMREQVMGMQQHEELNRLLEGGPQGKLAKSGAPEHCQNGSSASVWL